MRNNYQRKDRKSNHKFEVAGGQELMVRVPLPMAEVWAEMQAQVEQLTGQAGLQILRELCAGEKGGLKVGKTKRGKGSKIMAVADRHGLPVSICIESATPHEVKLATSTLVQMVVPDAPGHLIGDNAYDSDKLDAQLRHYGIEVIAPHRSNRRIKTQDERCLRRYRRRWKIERLFAWLQNFRRLVVRYERHAENFLGMLHLACCLILLRHL